MHIKKILKLLHNYIKNCLKLKIDYFFESFNLSLLNKIKLKENKINIDIPEIYA